MGNIGSTSTQPSIDLWAGFILPKPKPLKLYIIACFHQKFVRHLSKTTIQDINVMFMYVGVAPWDECHALHFLHYNWFFNLLLKYTNRTNIDKNFHHCQLIGQRRFFHFCLYTKQITCLYKIVIKSCMWDILMQPMML